MPKVATALVTLLALVIAGCAGESVTPVESDRLGVGTSPGFSDWITEPSIVNGDVVETLPDVDCPDCPGGVRQEGVVTGGSYGFDSNGDGAFDQELTLELVVAVDVLVLADGEFGYEWSFQNHGSGAIVAVSCGPNAPTFAISVDQPLLGTAGADRVVGTEADLSEGEALHAGMVSAVAPRPVLCAITTNPTTERALELLVPLPVSPDEAWRCKDGGWSDFGFRNQGQCVRFVETGDDSRIDPT